MNPDLLLSRDPAWRPDPGAAAAWRARAGEPGAPEALLREVRWWDAHAAALAGDWGRVSALAEAGLAVPFSEREAIRLALLHCLSGSLEEAEHVVAQAVQLGASAEDLPRRFAELCAREGLDAAAARFR
ncbi:hypothetical protein [Anaeromyxobacter oryzae]|uniref:Uncharacterized protein n=1 Tax=Anaeromyxobacter oryzae TaxID=2918170 RepID=A0ABN6MZT5_9BACT|nr:hypothetical protein [Anaeromyxobacter oryzae]BDG05272.1 hypothetical protein AMOR_42680 [Anaeromyxobacter oryzae]